MPVNDFQRLKCGQVGIGSLLEEFEGLFAEPQGLPPPQGEEALCEEALHQGPNQYVDLQGTLQARPSRIKGCCRTFSHSLAVQLVLWQFSGFALKG